MPKSNNKKCHQCSACRTPACKSCPSCVNKKGCELKICTALTTIEELANCAQFLEPDVADVIKIAALNKIQQLNVTFAITQSTEASTVGTLLRTLRTITGEVGNLASNVLAIWKDLGWGGWGDFLPPKEASSSEDEESSNEECNRFQATEEKKKVQETKSKKMGKMNLKEQKEQSEQNFKNLIKVEKLNDKNKYKCQCGKLLKTRAEAARHANICGKKPRFKKKKKLIEQKQCNQCDFQTVNEKQMNAHRKKEHPNLERVKCNLPNCSKSFLNTHTLREHLKSHETPQILKCFCCKKEFSQPGSRNRHILAHHKRELDSHAREDPMMQKDLELLYREGLVLEAKKKRTLISRIIKSLSINMDKNKNSEVTGEDDRRIDLGAEDDASEMVDSVEAYYNKKQSDIEKKNFRTKEKNHKDAFETYMCCDKEKEENSYLEMRKKQIHERMMLMKTLGLDEAKERARMQKTPRPSKPDHPRLPTRKSRRLRGLENNIETESLLVLAPDLEDYLNTAEAIPVMSLKELPKAMRAKPMPSVKIPTEDENPSLPIRFLGCVPLPALEDSTQVENHSVQEEDMEQDHSVLEEDTEQEDSVLEEDTEQEDSVLEEDTEQEDSVLEEDMEQDHSVLEEDTEQDHSVQEEESISEESEDERGRFPCDYCPFNTAADNKDLRRHVFNMHSQLTKPVSCAKFWCKKTFMTKYELKEHQRVCKTLPCHEEGCLFVFKWERQVGPHRRFHCMVWYGMKSKRRSLR